MPNQASLLNMILSDSSSLLRRSTTMAIHQIDATAASPKAIRPGACGDVMIRPITRIASNAITSRIGVEKLIVSPSGRAGSLRAIQLFAIQHSRVFLMKLCHEPRYLAGPPNWPGQELHFCKMAGDCGELAPTARHLGQPCDPLLLNPSAAPPYFTP
jgi:hypothetical protein